MPENLAKFVARMTELDTYRKSVERLAQLNSSEVFSNGRIDHARIIFETFFKFAQRNVVIFCEKLSKEVYNESSLINAAGEALNRRVTIRILTQRPPESEELSQLIAKWIDQGKPITIQTAGDDNVSAKAKYNFAVMDGKAYRFEPNNTTQHAGVREAFACMNDTDLAGRLLELFELFTGRTELPQISRAVENSLVPS